MAALVANNASSTLVGGLTTVATTLTVLANTGDVFPDVVAADSNWFLVTIIDGDKLSEIVKCTARNADELTIERGQEGTNALSFEDEDKVELRLTAGVINSFLTTTPGFNDLVDLPEAFKPAYEEAELYGRTLSDIRSYYFPTAYDANTDLLSISYAYIGVACPLA